MTSQAESDERFIERLENVAGVSNEDILSDEERLRAQSLLIKVQAIFPEWTRCRYSTTSSVDYPSKLPLPAHISRLLVALAPHKRLPSEILEHIFRSIDRGNSNLIPPVLNQSPWVLGRVCSNWRRLSRSMSDLWKSNKFEFHSYENDGDPAKLDQLRCAVQILPEHSNIDLHLVCIDCPATMRAIVPYLRHVNCLNWYTSDENTEQEATMDILPAGSFSRIVDLNVHMESRPGKLRYPDLFGKAPCLQDLELTSDNPAFLLCDIPWSQLKSFTFDTWVMKEWTCDTWQELRQLDPFPSMFHLRSLTLSIMEQLIPIFFSPTFPWNQLTSLSITIRHQQAHHMPAVMHAVQRSSALTFLKVLFYFVNFTERPLIMPYTLSAQQHLEHATLDVPFSTIQSLFPSNTLRVLEVPSCNGLLLHNFYELVRECPRLTDLTCAIVGVGGISTRTVHPYLPNLTSFSLYVMDPQSFPMLTAPSITSLEIRWKYSPENIIHLILSSGMKLERFYWTFTSRVDLPSQVVRDLLSALGCCTYVTLKSLKLSQNIFDDIATGTLLPCVESLKIWSPNPHAPLAMIKRRLERDITELGKIGVREFAIFSPSAAFDVEEVLMKEEVEQRYGVFIRFHGL